MLVKPEFLSIAYSGFRRAMLEWKRGQNSIKQIEEKYKAWPERLYVLDANGLVTWKSGLGPHLFDPDGFEDAIKALAG